VKKRGAPKRATLYLVGEGGRVEKTYDLDRPETVIGRAEGDVVFPGDGFMSGRHARIIERGGRFYLVDAGSRNGTFIRIDREIELESGDTFLVGKQVFRFD
jgi:pSer/pThr/pTyr-binding forkhead associated (FHA) protein